MLSSASYDTEFENMWCPGCGNFGIVTAMKEALAALGLPPRKVLLVSGIGQAAKTPHYLRCNFFHGLHGRALPAATGAKIANHHMTILVNSGDGDCYGEGGNHFISAIRRNVDITLLVHNNKVYGLTKGQASPTSDEHMVTRAQPFGVVHAPLNPLALALALNAGFVARGFSGDGAHLSALIQHAVSHRGFSLIDILQPCVSFNRINTHEWYSRRVYDVAREGYVPDDPVRAMAKAMEWGDRIPIGVLFRREGPTFTDKLKPLQKRPLVEHVYDPATLQTVLCQL